MAPKFSVVSRRHSSSTSAQLTDLSYNNIQFCGKLQDQDSHLVFKPTSNVSVNGMMTWPTHVEYLPCSFNTAPGVQQGALVFVVATLGCKDGTLGIKSVADDYGTLQKRSSAFSSVSSASGTSIFTKSRRGSFASVSENSVTMPIGVDMTRTKQVNSIKPRPISAPASIGLSDSTMPVSQGRPQARIGNEVASHRQSPPASQPRKNEGVSRMPATASHTSKQAQIAMKSAEMSQ